mmetsp:Transcript_39094/g.129417  ORF Transcript_39094/g.129417 Transcript_39094/m.129417 type:complete len:317 (-) Transcript_39094:675-1625(-)
MCTTCRAARRAAWRRRCSASTWRSYRTRAASSGEGRRPLPLRPTKEASKPLHAGVGVFGREYYFSGGVQREPLGAFTAHSGLPVHQTLELGRTGLPREVFDEYCDEVGAARFSADAYSLLENNCNHFSNECAQFLLGVGIPQQILDLPRAVLASPMGQMLRPLLEAMGRPLNASLGHGDAAAAAPPTQPSPLPQPPYTPPAGVLAAVRAEEEAAAAARSAAGAGSGSTAAPPAACAHRYAVNTLQGETVEVAGRPPAVETVGSLTSALLALRPGWAGRRLKLLCHGKVLADPNQTLATVGLDVGATLVAFLPPPAQ